MIAVVIPTIRTVAEFLKAWKTLLDKHNALVIVVRDGDEPTVNGHSLQEVMGEYSDVIYNYNSCVRNLGFAYVLKNHPETKYILTLDDDTRPIGDTIQDHIDALNQRVPVSWMDTASVHMRGFPRELRDEAEVVLSHGVWEGVKDWDAPTQFVLDDIRKPVEFYRGPIPRGIHYSMCGMNVMFKRKATKYMYWAPQGPKIMDSRFDDIWAGIYSKRGIDREGWAVVTGYAKVLHDRESNMWRNLQRESIGLEINEGVWRGQENDPYFVKYAYARDRWEEFVCSLQ